MWFANLQAGKRIKVRDDTILTQILLLAGECHLEPPQKIRRIEASAIGHRVVDVIRYKFKKTIPTDFHAPYILSGVDRSAAGQMGLRFGQKRLEESTALLTVVGNPGFGNPVLVEQGLTWILDVLFPVQAVLKPIFLDWIQNP